MRVAALCSEPDRRGETKAAVDRALTLERELWSGEPAPADAPGPAETAAAIEELTRAILKDAACGHLGGDLRATADEILLADGLAVGEGAATQRGETSEWALADEEPPYDEAPPLDEGERELPVDVLEPPTAEEPLIEEPFDDGPPEEPVEEPVQADLWADAYDGDPEPRPARLKVPEHAGRIRVEHAAHEEPEEESVIARTAARASSVEEATAEAFGARDHVAEPERAPAAEQREARVAYLFPRPETTEWNVRELAYDRRRRAESGEVRAS
jgi:hypothetical protein